MKLTKLERRLLANQYLILEKLYGEEAGSYASLRKAIEEGYELHYGDAFENLSDGLTADECREVRSVLDMHRFLHFAHAKLTPADKEAIPAATVAFDGYDGNNETTQMAYVRYVIEDQGDWSELKTGGHGEFNSHMPMISDYRAMVARWNKSRDKYALTKDDIIRITTRE